MRTMELFKFIQRRHEIYLRRQAGDPKPWTTDPILLNYRFCNVYRELDTVTQWLRKNWYEPNADHSNLWFAAVMARLVNWPDTLAQIGFPKRWDSLQFTEVIDQRIDAKEKTWGGAYIVSTNGRKMEKSTYIALQVLEILWSSREIIAVRKGDSLFHFYSRLLPYNGMGSFIAGQVVADLKYTPALKDAADWDSFAVPGPGSRRGLNRVMGRVAEKKYPGGEKQWMKDLHKLWFEISEHVAHAGFPDLHAQDLQNCLCEFDKYERARLGEGRPRATYPGRK